MPFQDLTPDFLAMRLKLLIMLLRKRSVSQAAYPQFRHKGILRHGKIH